MIVEEIINEIKSLIKFKNNEYIRSKNKTISSIYTDYNNEWEIEWVKCIYIFNFLLRFKTIKFNTKLYHELEHEYNNEVDNTI